MTNKLLTLTCILSLLLFEGCEINNKMESKQDQALTFPKGERVGNDNFTGNVWLQMLLTNDSDFNTSIGQVSFEAGARTKWHKHPSGQILLVTAGVGYHQEQGKEIVEIRKGDVIRCLPDVIHWHGGSKESGMSHIAISPNLEKGSVVWLEKVNDEEYYSFKGSN